MLRLLTVDKYQLLKDIPALNLMVKFSHVLRRSDGENRLASEVEDVFTARCTLVQSGVLRLHDVRLSVCLSVRLSVTLADQDHIGWKSWKLIARTLSLTPSLFEAQMPSTYSQGNMGKFSGD